MDASSADASWHYLPWSYMDEQWMGLPKSSRPDFTGRYKLRWDEGHLYLLVEVVDDTFINDEPDPLKNYWDKDALVIYLDADRSGGNYVGNRNAFAYNVSLDGKVAGIGADNKARFYNDEIQCAVNKTLNIVTWEFAIPLFDDNYKDGGQNKPKALAVGQKLGFAIGYNDVDVKGHNSFIGSMPLKGTAADLGENAGLFGAYELVK